MKALLSHLALSFSLDLGVISAIYYLLPQTQKLVQGTTLERSAHDGKKFKFTVGPQNKDYVALRQLPKYLPAAIIALEDGRFYEHRGFDFNEIFHALSTAVEEGRRLRGASTISQQLAKNIYLSFDRSLQRKLLEALITVKLELTISKPKILEIYINSIDWGRGLFGITDAAWHYFRKRPSKLSVREAVFLAAIIPNPAVYGRLNDDRLPKQIVQKRMSRALKALHRSGLISLEELTQSVYDYDDPIYRP